MSKSKVKRSKKGLAESTLPIPALSVVTNKIMFAKHLKTFMHSRGLTQSDLARAVWGTNSKTGGANKRDLINSYLAGDTLPSRETLQMMADKLMVDVEVLMPPTITPEAPPIDSIVGVDASTPGMVNVMWHACLPRHVFNAFKELETLVKLHKGRGAINNGDIANHFRNLHQPSASQKSA